MGDIVIIPPGLLGILPLAAARLNRNSPCFGDQWTVSFAPSVRSLIDCRERLSRTKGPDLLAVIDPPHVVNDKGDFAPRLPAAQREGDMLRRLATKLGLADNVLLHAQGRLVRVLKGLPEAYIFHAAAHAEGDVVVPDQTRVLLTGREALFARELRLQPLNRTRLIYLSACESGQTGIFRASDEFIGLPITFIQAGATGVVSTLWVIDDVAACLFAERFYWNLFDEIGDERMSPAAALRKTQQWLRGLTFVEREELLRTSHSVDSHSGPHQYTANSVSPQARPYESPHYWAAFAFTGA